MMNNAHRLLVVLLFLCVGHYMSAQKRVHVYTNHEGTQWDFPVTMDEIEDVDITGTSLVFNMTAGQGVPFLRANIDSLKFEDDPLLETNNPYKVFQLYLTTADSRAVTSREVYKPCYLSLNAQGSFSNYSGSANIRGRGNSSFLWYDKKPYRIKLDTKHKLLGLDKAKSWVLLANYRDVTDMMNTFVFEMGQWLGLPYTNHTPSFIKYLQIQEFVYNVELSAPRSIFMHKDGVAPWVMGPLWDFDAGYDFDWNNMYAGHDYFASFTETVMGSNPLKRNGNYSYVPQFFTDLFGCREFVQQYKAQWVAVKDSIVTHAWDECMKYVDELRTSGAIDREFQRWPLAGKSFDKELEKMHKWLQNRLIHISYLIAAIPLPDK